MRAIALMTSVLLLAGCNSGEQAAAPGDSATPESAQVKPPVDVSSLLTKAEQFAQGRDLNKAVEVLSQAIAAAPDNAEAYLKRARAYAHQGHGANALADFNSAIRLDPENATLYNSRGFFLMSRKQIRHAQADFLKAAQLDPQVADPHNNLGLIALAAGDLDTAIVEFSEALKIDPQNADALNNRGFAYFKNEQDEPALRDFERAMQVDPDDVNPYNNRGLLHFKREDYARAVADFTAAVQRDPQNPKHYQHRRAANLKLGDTAAAEADMKHLQMLQQLAQLNIRLLKNPRDPQRYLERGDFFVQHEEFDKALANYRRALEIEPQLAEAHSRVARVMLQQKQYEQCITACNEAIRTKPHHDAYSVRGDCYFQLASYDEAIDDFNRAKRFDATVAKSYLLRAAEYERNGNAEAAEADRRRAAAIDPDLATTRQ